MTEETITEGSAVEGFSLSAEEVNQLQDKHFKINAEPFYRELPRINDPTKIDKKLIVPIELANGVKVEWYANKTSQKVIIAKRGRILTGWVGYDGEFVIKEQKIGTTEKLVIYVKE